MSHHFTTLLRFSDLTLTTLPASSSWAADIPIFPTLSYALYKSEFCKENLPFDVVNLYTHRSSHVQGCNFSLALIERRVDITTLRDFRYVVYELARKNPDAAITFNGYHLSTDGNEFPFTYRLAEQKLEFVLRTSYSDNTISLQDTQFNLKRSRMDELETLCHCTNKLNKDNYPAYDEHDLIDFVKHMLVSRNINPKYYTVYFVDGKCYTEQQLLNKWDRSDVQHFLEKAGLGSILESCVPCFPNHPGVSIKRCVFDKQQLAALDASQLFSNIKEKLERERQWEAKNRTQAPQPANGNEVLYSLHNAMYAAKKHSFYY